METGTGSGFGDGAPALETSLVEWKLFFGGEGAALCFSLETSLVEWKQRVLDAALLAAVLALETSLVEWKRRKSSERGSGVGSPWKLP